MRNLILYEEFKINTKYRWIVPIKLPDLELALHKIGYVPISQSLIDTIVTEVSLVEAIVSAKAYVLFYRKKQIQ
jgi:hypothetical protein